MLSLYTLANAYQMLLDLSQDESDPTAWEKALSDIGEMATEKVIAIANIVRQQQANRAVIEGEIARLAQRRDALQNAENRLREYMKTGMQQLGIRRASDAILTVSVQTNSIPTMTVFDLSLVPPYARWCTVRCRPWELPPELLQQAEPTVDRDTLLKLHQNGEETPGVQFERGEHVRIR